MFSERESNGWILVEKKPETVKHKVLLLPGLQGSDLVFKKLMNSPVLGDAGVHAIAGNPPGFKGLPVPKAFDHAVMCFAILYEELAKELQVDMIVGHSFSANVLIELAARGMFNGKLMLVSPALRREAETKELLMLDSMSRKPVISGLMWWLTYQMMGPVFEPYFSDKTELAKAVKAGRMIPRSIGRKVLLGYFDHLDQYKDLKSRLMETDVPVWYLRGSKDDIKFTEDDKETLLRSRMINYVEIPDARHFAMIDKPDEVAAAIVKALKT